MQLANVSQAILSHAQTGPSEVPGQKVRNTLSPHFERLTTELIRAFIIKHVHAAQKQLADELISLRALMPEASQAQFDLSAARINEILQSLTK